MQKIFVLIGNRLLQSVLTMFLVSLFIFFSVELLPGDFAEEILGKFGTPETIRALRLELGLDQAAIPRYLNWVRSFFSGDLGNSFSGQVPISDLIAIRLRNTIFLAAYAAVIAIPAALTLGAVAALYRNTILDRLTNVFAISAISVPEFLVAYVLILFLSVELKVLPSLSMIGDTQIGFGELLRRTALPALTLTLISMSHVMRMTRAAIIGILSSPCIEMAALKGISKSRIIFWHALPNAFAPIINVVTINLAAMVLGVVVVEIVFVYPGLGGLLVDSVKTRDLPVVQVTCMIFGGIYIFLNLVADVLSIITNPRLMHPM